jgi:hypothetical protein
MLEPIENEAMNSGSDEKEPRTAQVDTGESGSGNALAPADSDG